MATKNITQLRRIVFRKKSGDDWETVTLNESEIGQDTVVTFNISPRMAERASQQGTTSAPIDGTFDSISASVSFLADTWEVLGRALGRWNAATYAGAKVAEGNIIFGAPSDLCAGGEYFSVIAQGVCDDGSSADVEFTRCLPAVDGDIELGTSSTSTVTLKLNPQLYNAATMSNDGYPQYTVRLGDNSLTEKQRLNASTGEYAPVN